MLALSSAASAFTAPMLPAHTVARSAVTMGLSWTTASEGAVWDPLNLAKTPEKFERLRYVEVKHGRIAMLAVVGHMFAASGARLPGELANGVAFTSIEGSGYKALSQLAPADLALIFITVGFLETRVMKETVKGEFPGDLRNGLFTEGWDNFSEQQKKEKMSKELNNGRAAMMGITGLMVHEAIGVDPYIGTGIDWRLNDIVPTWTAAGGGAAAVVEAVAPVAAVAEAVASP